MSLTAYKSSAGSGKTFTLVKEYLRLVIADPGNYKHILAITFTNKAANEMKDRILSSLIGMAYSPDEESKDLVEILSKELKHDFGFTDAGLKEKAGQVLGSILHGYSNFAVSTIDSFVHRLVRNFARELDLPVNFDVELDEDKLVSKSIDLLISKVGTNEQLTQVLVKFVENKMDDEKSWSIEKDLKDFTKILLKEHSVNAIKKLEKLEVSDFIKISGQLAQLIKNLESKFMQPAVEAMKIVNQNNLTVDCFYYAKSGVYSYFERIANHNFEKPSPNSYVVKMLGNGNWHSAKCTPAQLQTIQQIVPDLENCLNKLVSFNEEIMPQIKLFGLIHENIYPMAVLNEIEKVMDEFRENENIVHISEFNKRIARVVGEETVPFIYERIGEKYHHFLLDEFQDTSVLQWQNLLPLLENSLGSNHFNMIVGDGKQAIYRWRSGEVEQFAALPNIYNRSDDQLSVLRENLLKSHYTEKVLDTNYRSRKEIVEFNNAFFDFAHKHLPETLQKIYASQKQKVDPKKIGGMVELNFLVKGALDKDQFLQLELDRIFEIVSDLLVEYKMKEIAILTRSNADAGEVARFLLEQGVPVVTSEALRLSSSREVTFVISLLRYINDQTDRANIAQILIYLLEKNNPQHTNFNELLRNSFEINPGNPESKPLEDLIKTTFGSDFNLKVLRSLTLYEAVDEIVRTFDINEKGTNPFIRFFMDSILDFTARNDEGISDFLEFWDEVAYKKPIVIPEETEAIKVMTIHKAKGLQFPVVIFPFASGSSQIGTKELWIEPNISEIPQLTSALVKTKKALAETAFAELYHKEMDKSFLDLVNVLYVAMTRPKEKLFVILEDKQDKEGKWKTAANFMDNADLFHQYLSENGLWEAEKRIYAFGHTTSRILNKKPETEKPTTTDPELNFLKLEKGRWREKINIRYKSTENWDTENADRNRDRGILIHNIMAKIKTPDDISDALADAAIQGLLENSMKEKLKADILNIISSPAIKPFFDHNKMTFTEKDIILKNGDTIRPDRIVVEENQTSLIDYKTGVEAPQHQQQLEKYAEALHDMGYQNIRKYLIYLESQPGEIKVVNW